MSADNQHQTATVFENFKRWLKLPAEHSFAPARGSAKPLSGRQEAYTDYIRSLGDVTKAWTDAEWSICHAAFIQGWWTRGGDDPNSPNAGTHAPPN